MSTSDLKRFIYYLQSGAVGQVLRDSDDANALSAPARALDLDFGALESLLQRHENDPILRAVLFEPGEGVLERALEHVKAQLRAVEGKSIAAYIDEATPLNELHDEIRGCDTTLAKVEGRLGHFDHELTTVNREIKSLESDSETLAVMLRNRNAAADALSRWLDDTTVPPRLVLAVRDGNVGDAAAFGRALAELQAKRRSMAGFPDFEQLAAYPTLLELEEAAAQRVKAFLLERFTALRPGGASGHGGAPRGSVGHGASNAAMRRQALLPFRAYPPFLQASAPALWQAVATRYVEDSRAYLLAIVRTYSSGLAAVTARPEKVALVAPGDSHVTDSHGAKHGRHQGGSRDDHISAFELGSRAEDLLHPDFSRWPTPGARSVARSPGGSPATARVYRPVPLQSLGKRQLAPEYAAKALLHQICEAAAGDYVFLEDFFGTDTAGGLFAACWRAALDAALADLDAAAAACPDAVALLVMTRVVGHCQLQMTHAQVPALGPFLDRLSLSLWPHFARLLREHINSLTTDRSGSKARAVRPPGPVLLPAVRRATALLVSLGKLNAEYGDSQVTNNLSMLAAALQHLLYQVRLLMSPPIAGTVFHILNLQHIVSNLRAAYESPVRTLPSSEALPEGSGGLDAAATELCRGFEGDLDIARNQYIGDLLATHIREMVAAVTNAGASRRRSTGELPATLTDPAAAHRVMSDFRGKWKGMLAAIADSARSDFAASELCATDMTRACLEEVHSTYRAWLSALNAQGGELEAVARDGPSLQSLAYELREMVR